MDLILTPGQTLGGYRILGVIGLAGGWASSTARSSSRSSATWR